MLPALSTSKKVIVVMPSVLMIKEVEAALALVLGPACAPLAEYVISFTPVPPGSLSVEFSVTVTFVLFQPAEFGCGEIEADDTGGAKWAHGITEKNRCRAECWSSPNCR